MNNQKKINAQIVFFSVLLIIIGGIGSLMLITMSVSVPDIFPFTIFVILISLGFVLLGIRGINAHTRRNIRRYLRALKGRPESVYVQCTCAVANSYLMTAANRNEVFKQLCDTQPYVDILKKNYLVTDKQNASLLVLLHWKGFCDGSYTDGSIGLRFNCVVSIKDNLHKPHLFNSSMLFNTFRVGGPIPRQITKYTNDPTMVFSNTHTREVANLLAQLKPPFSRQLHDTLSQPT